MIVNLKKWKVNKYLNIKSKNISKPYKHQDMRSAGYPAVY